MTGPADRVRAYLDDLARMLSDLAPADRDEVLAGVREHVDASLEGAGDEDRATTEALVRLGPPQDVAAEARAALGSSSADPGPSAASRVRHRGWLVAGLALTLLSTAPFVVAALVGRLAGEPDPRGGYGSPVLMVVYAWPLWLASVVCLVLSRRRIPRTWKALLTHGPVSLTAVALTSNDLGPSPVAAFIAVPVLVAVLALLVGGAVTAWREQATAGALRGP